MKHKDYSAEDAKARQDYLNSRTDVIKKCYATDLWIKVISKAIDDIIYYRVLRERENKRQLKEEEQVDEQNAIAFLFDDSYKIPFDDYLVIADCPICEEEIEVHMSNLASGIEMCRNCSARFTVDDTRFMVKEVRKEVNLKELLSIIWGSEDVEIFRKGVIRKIESAVRKKLNG